MAEISEIMDHVVAAEEQVALGNMGSAVTELATALRKALKEIETRTDPDEITQKQERLRRLRS